MHHFDPLGTAGGETYPPVPPSLRRKGAFESRLPSPRRRGVGGEVYQPGTAGVVTSSSASVISNNLYDVFGVKRYEQGTAETPVIRRALHRGEDEVSWLATRGILVHRSLFVNMSLLPLSGGSIPAVGGEGDRQKYCRGVYDTCMDMAKSQYRSCTELCRATLVTCVSLCLLAGPFMVECQAGCLAVYGSCQIICSITKLQKERQCERIYWDCMGGKPGVVPLPPSAPPALQ